MFLKLLVGCYLILVATALFNKKIVETQDPDDGQKWHHYQHLQWFIIYGVILLLTIDWSAFELLKFYKDKALMTIIGFAFTWAFFYDGLLNWFMGKEWFYEGVDGFGKDYTIPKKIKLIMLLIGVIIITVSVI